MMKNQKQAKQNTNELEKMFKDYDKVIVFDSYRYKK